jgi:hypothetical protein
MTRPLREVRVSYSSRVGILTPRIRAVCRTSSSSTRTVTDGGSPLTVARPCRIPTGFPRTRTTSALRIEGRRSWPGLRTTGREGEAHKAHDDGGTVAMSSVLREDRCGVITRDLRAELRP